MSFIGLWDSRQGSFWNEMADMSREQFYFQAKWCREINKSNDKWISPASELSLKNEPWPEELTRFTKQHRDELVEFLTRPLHLTCLFYMVVRLSRWPNWLFCNRVLWILSENCENAHWFAHLSNNRSPLLLPSNDGKDKAKNHMQICG